MGAAERTGVAHRQQRLPRAVPNRPARRYVGYLTPCHPLWHCYGARYMASPGFRAMPQAIVAALSGRAAAAANGIGCRRRQALHACKHSPWQWMVLRRVPVQAFRRAACARATPYISTPMMAARRAGRATPAGGTARAPALVPGGFSHGRRQGMRHAGSLARHEKCRSARTERHGALRPDWPVACGAGRSRRGWRTRLPRPAPPALHAYHMITRCSGGRYIASPGLMSNAS